MTSSSTHLLKRLGPGLLFAGAAVGVSHLVYATRAGANFGFGLVWLVLITNLLKYPFFEFGPRYAAAKGESLLEGYRRLHRGVLWLFVLITLGTMFTVIAAVSLVTASLATNLFGITDNLIIWVILILGTCSVLLTIGRYQLLDRLMKFIIIALTAITLVTVIIAWGQTSHTTNWAPQYIFSATEVAFIIAFMGWMPAPLDLSVWHSLWALEKRKDTTANFDIKQSLFDFNIGYIGTTFLALFFLALGALVMYNSGETFSDKGGAFAAQLINLYT
jgi:Mn2+/Fe2+ NRAMP family transporter